GLDLLHRSDQVQGSRYVALSNRRRHHRPRADARRIPATDVRRSMKVVLASGNSGKLAELHALLAPLGIELVSQRSLGVDDAEETASTFVENALIKARHATDVAGLPAIADDSGIVVRALNVAPVGS